MSLCSSSIASSISPPRVGEGPSSTDSPELAELWKRSEYIRFSEHLRQVEEQQKFSLKKELMSVRKIETKLKQKLADLENKERDLSTTELNLKRTKDEMFAKLKRTQDDHLAQIKILNEQHAAELKIERDKSRSEEIRRKSIETDLGKLRTSSQPWDGGIERQLMLVQSELEQALERERILIQSREYFRTTVIKLASSKPEIIGFSIPKNESLLSKRTQLIESGMYDETDPVIQQIDLKINTSS